MLSKGKGYTSLALQDLNNTTSAQRGHHSHDNASKFFPARDTSELLTIDTAEGTRKCCIAGLAFSVLLGIGAIITGIVSKGSQQSWKLDPIVKEFVILPVNVILLLVTECLGYIHATSLRWSLFYEGKLSYNTNQRLLTFSTRFGPNNALFSIVFSICTALTYAAGNLLLVFNTSSFYADQGLAYSGQGNSAASWESVIDLVSLTKSIPIILGVAILTMSAIDVWCLLSGRIPSWSSDPLNTLAVGLNGGLVHRSGRALMSVRESHLPAQAKVASSKQSSLWSTTKAVRWILTLSVGSLVAFIVWSAVITAVAYKDKVRFGQNGYSWAFSPTTAGNFAWLNGSYGTDLQNVRSATITVFLFFFASDGLGGLTTVSEGRMLGVLLLYLVFQSVVTISLSYAELQVQLSRDENVWRKLSSRSGSQEPSVYNSIRQPVETWQGAGLLVFKVLVHWLFGAAVQVDYGQGMLMRPPQIIYMTAAWLAFVCFLIFVTFSKPDGSLPASYGHLQTMADTVDEWSKKMFWGDKGLYSQEDDTRHCGTSHQPLPPLVDGILYA